MHRLAPGIAIVLAGLVSAQRGPLVTDPAPPGVVVPSAEDAAAEPIPADRIDAEIEARKQAYREWLATSGQGNQLRRVREKCRELMRGFDIATLSPGQIESLLSILMMAGDRTDATLARLDALTDEETVSGLVAMTTAASIRAYAQRTQPDLIQIRAMLRHPAVDRAVEEGRVTTLFMALGVSPPSMLRDMPEKLVELSAHLDPETLGAEAAMSLGRYWYAVDVALPEGSPEREAVRGRVAATLRAVAGRETDREVVSALKDQEAMINGAFARGQLLDHPAPEIEFMWSSDPDGPAKLSDLRGKVVVIDFWATWCGPCVRSFPAVASLVDHFKGYDVVVLGVTTPQGRHHAADGTVTKTGGDREKEFSLMAQFIKDKQVTWPIVFTEHAVWTAYGVKGIPHMVIIDPKGIVRHRELHPMMDEQKKIEMVNELLEEAGLAHPDD